MTSPTVPRRLLSPDRIRELNSRTAELLSLYLNLTPTAITPDMVTGLANDASMTREQAYAMLLAMECGVSFDGDDRDIYYNYFVPMVNELDASDFESDPYYQNIKIADKTVGKWRLTNMKIAPCEAFVCNDFTVTERRELIPCIGYFMREFRYPAILESGREWMTLMPNETVTSADAIKRARGRVLTYGLGLGYFAYMASRKECVTSVTVVERSEEAAELFRTEILPQFDFGGKITLVIGDAVEYAEKTAPALGYDFIFADIWHDAGDGVALYEKFKSFEPLYKSGTEFSYWLERTIQCYLDKTLWNIK